MTYDDSCKDDAIHVRLGYGSGQEDDGKETVTTHDTNLISYN